MQQVQVQEVVEELELDAREYLGKPFLDGHLVKCKSLLSPISSKKEERGKIAASMTSELFAKLSAQSEKKRAEEAAV